MPMPAPAPTLHLPHPPTFPLSSPITEEIPSPVSSSSSTEEKTRDRRNKPLEVSTTARQTPFVHTSKDAHRSQMVVADRHSSANTDTDTNTDKETNMDGHFNVHGVAKRPTGLNLVTNFDSSLSVPKPKPMSRPRPRSRRRTPTFVDLNDLKSICRSRERERSTQQKIKGILKRGRSKRAQHVPDSGTSMDMGMGMRASVLGPQKEEDRLTPSHPKKKRKSELSPSDRPIPIGFTISHVDDSDEQTRDNNLSNMQDDNELTPLTPSIIVTPARDESSFWEDEEVDVDEMNHSHPHPRPRVASSVYSQPTPLIDLDTEVPPVPAIPACHSTEKIVTATPKLQQKAAGVGIPPQTAASAPPAPPTTTRNRTYSTGTVFEDHDSPREPTTSRSRSYSSGSGSGNGSRKSRATGNRKTLDRLSINTDTNRPQSQGWWTYLLSPLLARSSTVTSGNTPTSPGPGGDVRPQPKTGVTESTASSEDWWEKEVEVSCFSPDTPETPYGQRYPAGSREVQSTNPFVDGRSEQNTDASAGAGAGGVDIFAGQAIQGCAAEYYQACAHELFSGTPYFECENHICSITPEHKKPKPQPQPQPEPSHPDKTTPMSGKKGLALVEMDESHTVQSPESEKATSRAHRFSGSTAINDRNETPVYVNKGYFGTPITKPKRKPVGLTVTGLPGIKPDQGYGNSLDKPEQTGTRPATPVTPFYIPPAPPTPLPPMNTTVTVERAIVPPNTQHQQPDPISPAFQQSTERSGIPLSNMHTHTHTHTHTEATSAPAGHSSPNASTSLPRRPTPLPTTRGLSPSLSPSTPTRDKQRESSRIESRRQRHEKEEKVGKKAGGLWRGRGPFSKRGCLGRDGREGRMKRRWYFAIVILFLIILIIAILLAVFLTRKANHSHTTTDDPNNDTPSNGGGDDTGPVQSRWLNLTGYPPMPTGISTIAGPKPLHQESGCIQPNTLWSCALPKEQQAANEPYKADEPNFRVQIRFRNGTYEHSTTVASSKRSNGGGWDAVPPAPSDKDQRFLGNTTDGNIAPFEGEETPFFITFLTPSESSSSGHTRRAFTQPKPNPTLTRRESSASFPNLKDIIPSPATQKNGSPAPATLYPLPSSQPVRLYNRGKEDEHYGFYTYFDRSIFLQSSAPLNGGISDDIEGDKDGGAKMGDASVRCTWAQTRFLVQIWTRQRGGKKVLLQPSSTTTTTSAQPTSTSTSDAESYTRPGTLPYPITLTLDRHGGVAKRKMVYCYGIDDDDGAMNATALKLQLEDRAFKGSLVNEAPGVFNNTDVVAGDGGDVEAKGGIDGGSGGCGCKWGNWVSLT